MILDITLLLFFRHTLQDEVISGRFSINFYQWCIKFKCTELDPMEGNIQTIEGSQKNFGLPVKSFWCYL